MSAAAVLDFEYWERGASDETSAPAAPAPRRLPTRWDAAERQGGERSGSEESAGGGFVYDGALAGRALRAGLSRRSACARPLPLEEVALFVKEIDNADIRRRVAPSDKRTFWRMIFAGLAGLLLLVLCFGPRAWLRHAGYQQAALIEQRQELTEIQYHLQVRYAQLSDLRRVGRMAAAQGLGEPPPERYTWQGRTIPAQPAESAVAENFGPPEP